MSWIEKLSGIITGHSRSVIAVMLVLSLLMVPGLTMIEQSSSFEQFQGSSTESEKLDYIDDNFRTGAQNTTSAQVIFRGDNVLSKGALIGALQAEQSLLQNTTIRDTLVEERPIHGVANVIATSAIRADSEANATDTSLDAQIAQLNSMSESEIDEVTRATLGDSEQAASALTLMHRDYEPGSTSANATMLMVTQQSGGGGGLSSGATTEAQLAMQTVLQQTVTETDVMVFGSGLMSDEIQSSSTDSMLIVGPLAILFVFLALAIAYRDIIDIALGMFGVAVVLFWTFGAMGWAGINFNQMMIAVVVLLIGLAIDYAIHIFMRHREERQKADTPSSDRSAMNVALTSVGIALIWVTATGAIGFLSNYTSPIPPIREFGLASAVGISAALVIFGVFIPALKIEIDTFLEGRGWDRTKTPFGTGGGRLSSALAVGSKAARAAPVVMILIAIVLSGVGAYGATQVDTSAGQEAFIAEDPPGWMKDLPEPFAPGEYTTSETLDYLNGNFFRQNSQAQILAEGDLTDPDSLRAIREAVEMSGSSPATVTVGRDPKVEGPLSVLRRVASENESFNQTLTAADTDGDGVPDQNLEAVYDDLFAIAPQHAGSVIERTESGDYVAARLVISTDGSASGSLVTSEMRALADGIEAESGLVATATGDTITSQVNQTQLLNSVLESLIIALVAVFAFLMLTYRKTEGSASLGAVTLLPVVFSVTWIFGSMYALDIPFNMFTGMISTLTIGLGVAYSIHLSERYNHELQRTGSMWRALNNAVTGTGGALLGSAATTVGGFGVLALAILPPLQQFGIITALTIVYAFLASMLVLPSLLVLWTRYFGPDVEESVHPTQSSAAAGDD